MGPFTHQIRIYVSRAEPCSANAQCSDSDLQKFAKIPSLTSCENLSFGPRLTTSKGIVCHELVILSRSINEEFNASRHHLSIKIFNLIASMITWTAPLCFDAWPMQHSAETSSIRATRKIYQWYSSEDVGTRAATRYCCTSSFCRHLQAPCTDSPLLPLHTISKKIKSPRHL